MADAGDFFEFSTDEPEDQQETGAASEEEVPRKRIHLDYRLDQELPTVDAFNAWWTENKKGWTSKGTKKNKAGEDVASYSCSKGKDACDHKVRIIFSAIDSSVRVETTLAGNHDDIHTSTAVLTKQVKARISELSSLNLKPAVIRNRLLSEMAVARVPTLSQIQNFVKRQKNKITPPKPLTEYDLIAYAESKARNQDDENKPFVASFMPFTDDHFLIAWTTGKLESVQAESNVLATDATYKLSWHGFPIFIAGTFDLNNSFHPTYVALASHEDLICFRAFFSAIAQDGIYSPNFIMADAAQAITGAAEQVFSNSTKRLMCWAHAIKNIDKRLKGVPTGIRGQMRGEIMLLQYAMSDEQFKKMAGLLVNKWMTEYGDDFEFAGYFKKTWVDSPHYRWFEGSSLFPSTNNSLENLNKQVKSAHTFRERLPFHQLTAVIERMIEFDWSIGRQKPSEVEPRISPSTFAKAYQLRESKRKVLSTSDNSRFVLPSASFEMHGNSEIMGAVRMLGSVGFESFGEYEEARFKVYMVSKIGSRFVCSCRQGAKKHACKHSVMIQCRLGLLQYPPDATAKTIGQKPKRGRPKKIPTQR